LNVRIKYRANFSTANVSAPLARTPASSTPATKSLAFLANSASEIVGPPAKTVVDNKNVSNRIRKFGRSGPRY
jgi:hypothetical protein